MQTGLVLHSDGVLGSARSMCKGEGGQRIQGLGAEVSMGKGGQYAKRGGLSVEGLYLDS